MTRAGSAVGAALLAAALLAAGFSQAAGSTTGAATGSWTAFGNGVERPGVTDAAVGSVRSSWFFPIPAMVTTQALVARDVPRPGDSTAYVGTADGFLDAFSLNGYLRWQADLGRLAHTCPQIPGGWGVTGTPVIDSATRTLYVADAFGRLHALDLATGAERRGWPVLLYRDFRSELVWGALLLAKGSVYAATGSYCDQSTEGKVVRVELAKRSVTSWTSVTAAQGGGGGIWGWGGPVYSPGQNAIFVATGNALEGGSNAGASFSEQAGYGEHLVELSPGLAVKDASAPNLGKTYPDNDLSGSPVIARSTACKAEIVAAQAKSGVLFGWRAAAVSAGPIWQLALQKSDPVAPLLTQPTYSKRLDSFFVVTSSELVRIALGAGCKPRVAWRLPLGKPTLYGSPTVAGNVAWVTLSVPSLTGRPEQLLGVDVRTGRVVSRRAIGGTSFAPPSVIDGMLVIGAMHAFSSKPFPVGGSASAARLSRYASFADAKHGWQGREDGVYSTDDGGRSWRRIYKAPAVRVVRTSATAGVISVGLPASSCNCATTQLITLDGGRTWTRTRAISGDFEGRGSSLYWWDAGTLQRVVNWPAGAALRSRVVAHPDGTIVSAASGAGGVAALVDRGAKPPQVIVSHGSAAQTVTLPDAGPGVVARTLSAAGPALTVRGRSYAAPSTAPDPLVQWRSTNGGASWRLLQG
jgi:hypothetical protein